jgi:hypothetical protein
MTRQRNNSVEKKMSSGGSDLPPLDMKQFIKMASETPREEFEMDLKQILSEYPTWQKNNPNKTYDDFLEENGIRRVELKNGGGLGLKFSKDTLIDFIKGEFPRDYIRLEKRLKIMSPEDVEQQLDYLRETKRNN